MAEKTNLNPFANQKNIKQGLTDFWKWLVLGNTDSSLTAKKTNGWATRATSRVASNASRAVDKTKLRLNNSRPTRVEATPTVQLEPVQQEQVQLETNQTEPQTILNYYVPLNEFGLPQNWRQGLKLVMKLSYYAKNGTKINYALKGTRTSSFVLQLENNTNSINQALNISRVADIANLVQLNLNLKQKAQQRTKGPYKSTTADLQDALYKIGAFGNLSYKKAVDGLRAKNKKGTTDAAIKWALGHGYIVDEVNGTVTKLSTLPETKGTVKKKANGLASMYEMTHAALTGGMNTALLPKKNKSSFLDNMYPYSYGDVIVNDETGEVLLYNGEVPLGFTLRQTTSQDSPTLLLKSLISKTVNSFTGKDPRRAFIDELAKIDLNTSEGRQKYFEMVNSAPNGVIRIHGNPENDLFEIKARLDLANSYTKGTDPAMFEINNDYNSPTAKLKGQKTYRIKDPKQRERIYGEMTNYFLQHKNEGHWNNDHTAFILPHMGYLGNLSMIADDENGLNLRYGDYWDYTVNTPNGRITYMGDRLVPEGTYPQRTKYGIGHNSKTMTESTDDLVKNVISEQLNNIFKFNN